MARLREMYKTTVVKALKDSGKFSNPMEFPRLTKIVLNMGVNSNAEREALKAVAEDLARITGQRPVITKARKSIANFKLRTGMPIGAKVTLRGNRMYEFLDRFITAALPRIRDFRGVSPKGFDGRGNYTLGVKEQTIFAEIQPDQVKKVQGMDITFVTTARDNEAARQLLTLMGIPFASA
jgi:large subunit ribosomal protein L5